MSKDYTKQHIVPQFYLKGFATKQKVPKLAVRRVFYTNKVDIKVQSISELGVIKKYYSISSDADYAFYEKLISREIEYPLSKAIKKTIANSIMCSNLNNILTESIICDLAKYIVFQGLRVPAFYGEQLRNSFKIIKKTKKEMIRDLYYLPNELKKQIKLLNFKEDDYKKIVLGHITDKGFLDSVSKVLIDNHVWFAYINSCADYLPFTTSDNPVVISNIVSGQIGIKNGFGSKDISILFPLSPKIMIQAIPKKLLAKSQFDKNTLILEQKDIPFIVNCNLLQEKQRFREAYYPVSFYKDVILLKED